MKFPEFLKYRFGFLVPLIVVLLVGAGVVSLSAGSSEHVTTGGQGISAVDEGGDYYVSVVLVELGEKDAEGNSWDVIDGSAPDPRVEIHWRGQKVYSSSVKKDTLIGHWSNAEIDFASLAMSGGKTSIDSLMQGARINVRPGEKLEIRVFDNDPLGSDDLAGELVLYTEELPLGDRTFQLEGAGLSRVQIRVQSMKGTPDIAG